MNTREFHIGDILSMLSGRLVAPTGMQGIYGLAQHMTGGPVWTHQLPRVMDEAVDHLREQHPDLAAVDVPKGLNSEAAVLAWLVTVTDEHGTTRHVRPLAPVDHTDIDPIQELHMRKQADR